MTFARLRAGYGQVLEAIVIGLMVILALEVTVGVVFCTFGKSLVWYDEIAAILLAWLTYYGAALAAFKRAHIGCPGPITSLKPALRLPLTIFAEACVFGFFVLLAWIGYSILDVLATDHLVTLPKISVAWVQSVIPIGAVLFIIAEAFNLPDIVCEARGLKTAASGAAAETSH